MERTINISGVDVEFKSSGALIRLYRTMVGRDLLVDMQALEKNDPQNPLNSDVIEILENVAYVMNRHANPKEKRTIEKWLEQFSTFGLAQALPEIIALWTNEISTQSDAKKNEEQ